MFPREKFKFVQKYFVVLKKTADVESMIKNKLFGLDHLNIWKINQAKYFEISELPNWHFFTPYAALYIVSLSFCICLLTLLIQQYKTYNDENKGETLLNLNFQQNFGQRNENYQLWIHRQSPIFSVSV